MDKNDSNCLIKNKENSTKSKINNILLQEKIQFELNLYGNPEPSMDKIIDKVYLGNYAAAINKELLISNDIKFILVASNNMECLYSHDLNIIYKKIPVNDSKKTRISKFFKESNDFIEKAINSDEGNLLIHCGAGASRSVTLLIAYLIYKFGLNFDESFAIIKKTRNEANPNEGFILQLKEYSYVLKNPL